MVSGRSRNVILIDFTLQLFKMTQPEIPDMGPIFILSVDSEDNHPCIRFNR